MHAIIRTATPTTIMDTIAARKQRSTAREFAECGSGLSIQGLVVAHEKDRRERSHATVGWPGWVQHHRPINHRSGIVGVKSPAAQELGAPTSPVRRHEPGQTIFPRQKSERYHYLPAGSFDSARRKLLGLFASSLAMPTSMSCRRAVAVAQQVDRWQHKPLACILFPLTIDHGTLTIDDWHIARVRACNRYPMPETSIYEACQDELRHLLGAGGVGRAGRLQKKVACLAR
jgi:hypothetical protein